MLRSVLRVLAFPGRLGMSQKITFENICTPLVSGFGCTGGFDFSVLNFSLLQFLYFGFISPLRTLRAAPPFKPSINMSATAR